MSIGTFSNIRKVQSFNELIAYPFRQGINAVGWQRSLQGNFEEIVVKLNTSETLTQVTEQDLRDLELSDEGSLARNTILNDLQLLSAQGAAPILNIIDYYERDSSNPFFPTDVYSFHVDRSPFANDTYLCTYYGACSELLANEDAEQLIQVETIRANMRQHFKGSDSDFETYLIDNYYDLHYRAKSGAQPYRLGLGELWRLAGDYPNSKTLPCIHRAPLENKGEKRLMLIC